MVNYFRNIGVSAVALAKGLGVTLKYLFKPAITVQYPYQKLQLSPRYRGALAFHSEICVSCDMCVRACPSDCISLTSTRGADGKKKLNDYQINFAKCNFCRLCEEVCPTKPKSVHHTLEYELSFNDREDFVVKWVAGTDVPHTDSGEEQVWRKFMPEFEKTANKK